MGTAGSYAGVTISAGTLSSQIRTFSFFGKSNTASNQTMQFRKDDGSVATNITITPEWQRFLISQSVASTNTGFQIWSPFNVSYTANVDISIWGMQLEEGSFPTSYISTSGAAASRSADVASIPTSAFGYNADKGTVVNGHIKSIRTGPEGLQHPATGVDQLMDDIIKTDFFIKLPSEADMPTALAAFYQAGQHHCR
jgi:hypothetical protein